MASSEYSLNQKGKRNSGLKLMQSSLKRNTSKQLPPQSILSTSIEKVKHNQGVSNGNSNKKNDDFELKASITHSSDKLLFNSSCEK